ncbi:MAG: 3-dehydroquinate dehydratase [Acholeplasmataceae bacterium]|nr:3-dehydroquinate dehydratase [Acholeplasmataceae bacterium]
MNLLVIHGPNLNMLGKRNQALYGSMTLENLYEFLTNAFVEIEFTFLQTNHEGEIIDTIQQAVGSTYDALLINPGAYTHSSIAIRDALEMLSIPKVEVHFSNIEQREPFRKTDFIQDVVDARFMGKKHESYLEAVEFLQSKMVV